MKKVFVMLVVLIGFSLNVNAQKDAVWGQGQHIGQGVYVYYGYSISNGRKASYQDLYKFENTNSYRVQVHYYMQSDIDNNSTPRTCTIGANSPSSRGAAKTGRDYVAKIVEIEKF